MKRYESPRILVNEELAEGVYAASGMTAKFSVNVNINSNNGSDTVYFNGSVNGNTEEVTNGWTVELTFDGPVKEAVVYNCIVTINGNNIIISNGAEWNAEVSLSKSQEINGRVKGDKILSLL